MLYVLFIAFIVSFAVAMVIKVFNYYSPFLKSIGSRLSF